MFESTFSKSRDETRLNLCDLSSISDQSPAKNSTSMSNPTSHPFKGPKLHLFKKGTSRRIKTSSATRNLEPIYPIENRFALNYSSINTIDPTNNEYSQQLKKGNDGYLFKFNPQQYNLVLKKQNIVAASKQQA